MKKLLYLVLFAVLMYLGIQQAREMGAARQWPSTEGVISEARILRSQQRHSEKNAHALRYEYEVRVQYTYSVAGIGYHGDRLRIRSNQYRSEATAQRELAQYPAGRQVRVYYDPQEPQRSVLRLD